MMHLKHLSNLGPPIKAQHYEFPAVTNPSQNGILIIGGQIGHYDSNTEYIYEMYCNKSMLDCGWTKATQKLQKGRKYHLAFWISQELQRVQKSKLTGNYITNGVVVVNDYCDICPIGTFGNISSCRGMKLQ